MTPFPHMGDGANDGLALGEAALTGTPVVDRDAVGSKADFFFLGNGLRFLSVIEKTVKRRRLAVTAVVGFAILYNLVAAILCLAGLMNPLLAAILMPASSLLTLALGGAILSKR